MNGIAPPDRLAAHREPDAEPLVAAPLLELGPRDVDVQRRQRMLDVEHQHRHPDEAAAGDAVQRRRARAESVEARRRLGQHAPARDVGVHDLQAVEHLAALREHGGCADPRPAPRPLHEPRCADRNG